MNYAEAAPTARNSSAAGQRNLGMIELVVSLSVVGAAVYAVAGLPRIPTSLPVLPADLELQLELLVRSPTRAQQDAAIFLLCWAFWLGWVFVAATTLLRIGVIFAERAAEGAMWVRSLRWLSDLLTLPFVRRAVDASLAGTLLLRATLATPAAALASDPPIVIHALTDNTDRAADPGPDVAPATLPAEVPADLQRGDIVHIVRPGESLAYLGGRYLGDPNGWKQIYSDNRDRPQPDGSSLQEAGKISPGWLLIIRNPTQLVEYDAEGLAWRVTASRCGRSPLRSLATRGGGQNSSRPTRASNWAMDTSSATRT